MIFFGPVPNPRGRLNVSRTKSPTLSSVRFFDGSTLYTIFPPSSDIEALVAPESVAGESDGTLLNKEIVACVTTVSYTHLRAHETDSNVVWRVLLEK